MIRLAIASLPSASHPTATILSAAGSIANTYIYDSFGRLTNSTGSVVNPFRYTARESDTETGLYYYRARYYDPQTGRFASEDPIDFAGGIDFYRYVSNNPTLFFDPTGLREYPNNFVGPLPPDGYYTSQMEQTRCGRIPPHPPGSDVDHNISAAMDHLNPWWFKSQVKNKGPWDYKQKGHIYEDFGNFNYGASGHAFGFPDTTLLREAGRANQIADPRRRNMGLGDPGPRWNPWGGKPPYGDDQRTKNRSTGELLTANVSWDRSPNLKSKQRLIGSRGTAKCPK